MKEMPYRFGDAIWRLDSRLKDLIAILPGIRLLSLDIFDTLLFRACQKPEDIYEVVGQKAVARKILHPWFSPADYKAVRTSALDTAYQKRRVEPHLEDILACLPPILGDVTEFLDLELSTEAEICYLNPSIFSLVKECRDRGISIVLLSDMYLGCHRLTKILKQNGFPMEWIDSLMVSTDEGVTKGTGELFQKMLEQNPDLMPSQILHIGDNLSSEIVPACRLGIQTCHYDVVQGETTGVLDYETLCHKEVLPELFSLRSLAMSLNADVAPTDRRWHQLGSGVLGPFLSAFCDWIVDIAVAEEADAIAPFMREAVLLTPMLEKVIKHRKLELPVLPVNVSRQAVVLPGNEKFDEDVFQSMVRTRQYFRVCELFSTLGIDEIPKAFLPYRDTYLEKAGTIRMPSEILLYDALKTHLLGEHNKRRIEETFRNKRLSLLSYVDDVFGGHKRIITVDIGFFGQIQDGLESALKIENRKIRLIHLMAFGRERLVTLLGKGLDFRFFAGGMGCNQDLVREIHRSAPIIEQMLMAEEGSTVGYAKSPEGRWMPVVETNPIENQEIENKLIVQSGVKRFQDIWLNFSATKPDLAKTLRSDRQGWSRLIHRLVRMPTSEEADLIGDLHNDTNFGSTKTVCMCPPDEEEYGKRVGPKEYFKAMRHSSAVWPHGILTRIAPAEIVFPKAVETHGEFLEMMIGLAQNIRNDGFPEVIVYGTDVAAARDFIRAARISGIYVICAVDNNNHLCVGRVEGVEIVNIAKAMEIGNHCFAVSAIVSAKEIQERILNQYSECSQTPAIYLPAIA